MRARAEPLGHQIARYSAPSTSDVRVAATAAAERESSGLKAACAARAACSTASVSTCLSSSSHASYRASFRTSSVTSSVALYVAHAPKSG